MTEAYRLTAPEQTHLYSPQPLDPKVVMDFPLTENPLVAVSRNQHVAAEAWYGQLERRADAHLRPQAVTEMSELQFAHFALRVVREGVAYDTNRQSHELFKAQDVMKAIEGYYATFPATQQNSTARIGYQDRMIPYALDMREKFLEVGVMLAIQRIAVERGHRHASRATFAAVTAYGAVTRAAIYEVSRNAKRKK